MGHYDDQPRGWVIGDADDYPDSDGWHPRWKRRRRQNQHPIAVACIVLGLVLYGYFKGDDEVGPGRATPQRVDARGR